MEGNLKNPPLIEVIFELRWKLEKSPVGGNYDPHYKILIGRMYDRLIDDYPDHIQLPSSSMPDEFAEHVVQNQFRSENTIWPLVQLGPGILTINTTENYSWNEFEDRILKLINALFESYPNAEANLDFSDISLRYIDAVDLDIQSVNSFDWLKNKMNIKISLGQKLFEHNINHEPLALDFKTSFETTNPMGSLHFRLATGTINDESKMLWETTVTSHGENIPPKKEDFNTWINDAHVITHDWFLNLIEGELKRSFE